MTDWPLAAVVLLVAAIYASVGHAGATGYIAVMTLWGLAPEVIRPTALVLNVLVATIGTVQFARAGHLDQRLLVPLVVASVPAAALGGWLSLPRAAFETVLGVVLGFAAIRLAIEAVRERRGAASGGSLLPQADPNRAGVLGLIGGFIGLLSGLTGVGGGVFLTPLLLALRAAPVRTVAATSAAFILVNSLAGLAGGLAAGRGVPLPGVPVVAAAAAGGLAGASLGAFRLPVAAIKLLMATVLAIAAAKSLL